MTIHANTYNIHGALEVGTLTREALIESDEVHVVQHDAQAAWWDQ